MIGYLLAGGYLVGAALNKEFNPLKWIGPHLPGADARVTTSVEAGKVYALNVLSGIGANDVMVHSTVVGLQGGALFATVGKKPALVKRINAFPGFDLRANFGGQANQWIVYVQAKKNTKLPLQPFATLIITSAFSG